MKKEAQILIKLAADAYKEFAFRVTFDKEIAKLVKVLVK